MTHTHNKPLNTFYCRLHLSLFIFFTLLSNHISAATRDLIPSAPNIAASSYFLQDYHSGKVLAEKNADDHLAPASLTKIMAVYVVFREIQNGNLELEDKVTISEKAWRTKGSRMFVEVNKQVTIDDLLKGVIIQSGNDASVALAEHIAGDESTFAELMNQHAERLGMHNTHYSNSMGLPSPDHYTTARDLAIVTQALINEFPEFYAWHAIKAFTFNSIKQHNRNKLLWRDETVDGVKTGYTEEAGYCLVTSAIREDMRLISVVLGSKSPNTRAKENQALLNYGFRFFETHRLYQAEETLTQAKVWKGQTNSLALGIKNDLYVTIPRRHYDSLKATIAIEKKIIAPIETGQMFGNINVDLGADRIAQSPLVALQSVAKGSFFQRLYDEALLHLE